jgi:hypothetical protein
MRRANIYFILFSVFLLTFLFVLPAFSQQRWERTYGGTTTDEGFSGQQTTDWGYIVAGWTTSFGNGGQVYLIKTNANGDTLWTRTYGGTNLETGLSVQQTSDGGYVVAGRTDSYGNGPQVYLIKTNSFGDTIWTRIYGGSGAEYVYSIQQTTDGGYIVAGFTNSFGAGYDDFYLIKTDALGDTLWTRTYGGTNYDWGYSVRQTLDGGYIVTGYTGSFGAGSDDVWLIKTNASGDTLWSRTYGGAGYDAGNAVQQTSDTGYIVAGYTGSFGNGYQVYLIKTNSFGDTLWTRTYGGAGYDAGQFVQQTLDGGYIVAGYTNSFGNGWQVYLIKTNASGDTLWTRTYGGTAGDEEGYSVQQTTDGGYIVAGYTTSFGNSYQVYLIKTDANGSSGVEETAGVRDQGLGIRLTAKPNPFTSFATVPGHSTEFFSLYDISGRKVGVYKGDRIGEGLAPGVYFVRALEGKAKPVRVVKVR